MQKAWMLRLLSCLCSALLAPLLVIMAGNSAALAQGPGGQATENPLAQYQSLGTISEVEVRGNQRVERETVLAIFGLFPGDSIDPVAINEGVRALFDSGLFADVSVNIDGSRILIDLVENVFVNRVIFEGNSTLDDEILETVVALKPLSPFSESLLQDDLRTILRAYNERGHFNVSVVPQVIERDQGRVDVVFEINEGKRLRISALGFVGNTVYSDSRLQQVVASKPRRWWRRITGGDVYSPAKLEFDSFLLTRFYQERGYADMYVSAARGDIDASGEGVVVTYSISEGRRYRINRVRINANLRDVSIDEMGRQLSVRSGELYDISKIEASAEALNLFLSNRGHPSVIVTPELERNPDKGEIDLIFKVEQGPRLTIERIEIRGNSRTRDYVIRRELRVSEGDTFNRGGIARSQQRLSTLGYFTNVGISTGPGSADDKAVLYVDVEEGPTGQLNIGGSYASDVGFSLKLGFTNSNLLGRGQSLGINLNTGSSNRTLNINFFEPYFAGRNMGAGAQLKFTENNQGSSYNLKEYGAGVNIGYELSERVVQRWSYRLELTDIDPKSGNNSPFLASEAGSKTRGVLSHSLSYIDVDDGRFPTDGLVLRMNNEFAGLGGNVRWFNTTGEVMRFWPIGDGGRISAEAELGFALSLDDGVPFADRFVGRDLVRGFSSTGIGPREKGGDELAFRGTKYYAASSELTYPLPGLGPAGFFGRTYLDLGAMWDPGDAGKGFIIDDSSQPRWSYGFGVTWVSPLGPLNFDWAWGQNAATQDDLQTFKFGVNSGF